MDRPSKLRLLCESYLKRAMALYRLDLLDFAAYMEPLFKRYGYREGGDQSNEANSSAWQNILIVRLDSIGECVLTTGLVRELRKNFPAAHLTMVVNSSALPLMELCPHVDEVYAFSGRSNATLQEILHTAIGFCQQYLWKRSYDVSVCPRWGVDENWSLLLGYMSGARIRIGYSESVNPVKAEINQGYDIFLTHPLIAPPEYVHEAARAFYILRAFGLNVTDDDIDIWYEAKDENIANRRLRDFAKPKGYAVLALGADKPCKKYPVEKYAAALKPLIKNGLKFVLLGGSQFELEGFYFYRLMPRGSVMNLIGQVSPRVTAAIIAQAAIYIGNDNSLAHIAAALKIPVLEIQAEAADKTDEPSIYSTYERYFPWKVPAIVLRPEHALAPCDHTPALGGCSAVMQHCIAKIPPQEVRLAYESLREYTTEGREEK